jgi:hypothetical protein
MEGRLNLVWLKYVSYACVAGAAFFYGVVRLNWLAISRTAKLAGYAACIVLACVTWHVQESNTDQHSPRQLVMGTVVSVSAKAERSGRIEDEFQLRIDGGSLSPKFSTDVVADSRAQQPIHTGDTLGVLYRTWDNVPLTIDEFQGQQPGWHYRRYQVLNPYVWAVAIAGLFGFIGAAVASRKRSARLAEANLDPTSSE